MLTFMEFIKAACSKTITFTSEEVRQMEEQAGDAFTGMGNVQNDGCLAVRMARVAEAAQELADFQDDSDLLFEMANLTPKDTGLPFVVWISPKGNARHDVRIKVSRSATAKPSEMVSVAIRPTVRVVAGSLSANELALLRKWVELNQDVIVRYWNGEIESTKDALAATLPLKENY